MMAKDKFHTTIERMNNIEVSYMSGEDFIEMGSISGFQYMEALRLTKLYEKSSSITLLEEEMLFVERCALDFTNKYDFCFTGGHTSYEGAEVEFYRLRGWKNYRSLLLTIFNDYNAIWVKVQEVSHQFFYPQHYNGDFTIEIEPLIKSIDKAKLLFSKYPKKEK
jgi:hypothetical protein